MLAKAVHQVLKEELRPALKELAFRPMPGIASAWYREGSHEFQLLRIHLGKFGYMQPLGGELHVRAWCSEYLVANSADISPMTLRDLVPEPFLRGMRDIRDGIFRRILAEDWEQFLSGFDQVARAGLEARRNDLEHSLKSDDVLKGWRGELAYVDAEDVRSWSKWLVGGIPYIVATLTAREGGRRET